MYVSELPEKIPCTRGPVYAVFQGIIGWDGLDSIGWDALELDGMY